MGSVADAKCREMTASYVRARRETKDSACDFFNVSYRPAQPAVVLLFVDHRAGVARGSRPWGGSGPSTGACTTSATSASWARTRAGARTS